MDLRRTLVSRLALAFLALMLAFGLVWLQDLRDDALAEQQAAARLVDLLLAPSASDPTDTLAHVRDALAQGQLRHVKVSLWPLQSAVPELPRPSWGVRWLGLDAQAMADRRLVLGDQVLLIRPDAESEFQEKRVASLQVLAMLVLFGAASLGMTWLAVDRALSPVKELQAGLTRLQAGEDQARLPGFALREFAAIAQVVDRLADSLRLARESQRRLTRQLMDVQDKERRELSAELHDEFGQSLTAITASAAYIEHHAPRAAADTLVECAREIGQESRRIAGHVRQMLSSLRPYGMESGAMAETLAELVSAWTIRLPDRHLAHQIEPLPRLSADVGLALYRSLQEALTNCVRHSGASRIEVHCAVQGERVGLTVTDNGSGQAAQLLRQAGGGLLGLRERLAMVGGSLHISDRPGGGVSLQAWVPIVSKADT